MYLFIVHCCLTFWGSFSMTFIVLFPLFLTVQCESFVRCQNNQQIDCGHERKVEQQKSLCLKITYNWRNRIRA